MLARQRQALIAELVQAEGAVRVAELTTRLGVSDMTIRRDLDVLARLGLIDKVHGGATQVRGPSTDEPGFSAKAELLRAEKEAIAREAASLIQPGQAVAIGAGTTPFAVSRQLCAIPRLTVVTNSLPVSDAFHRSGRPDQTVVLTGGIRTPSDALVGPVAMAALRGLHVDVLILGAHGIDADAGLTSPNLLEGEVNRALLESAKQVVVVADHSKWGAVALSGFAALEEIDVLVTDDGISASAREELADRVSTLVTVTAKDEATVGSFRTAIDRSRS